MPMRPWLRLPKSIDRSAHKNHPLSRPPGRDPFRQSAGRWPAVAHRWQSSWGLIASMRANRSITNANWPWSSASHITKYRVPRRSIACSDTPVPTTSAPEIGRSSTVVINPLRRSALPFRRRHRGHRSCCSSMGRWPFVGLWSWHRWGVLGR